MCFFTFRQLNVGYIAIHKMCAILLFTSVNFDRHRKITTFKVSVAVGIGFLGSLNGLLSFCSGSPETSNAVKPSLLLARVSDDLEQWIQRHKNEQKRNKENNSGQNVKSSQKVCKETSFPMKLDCCVFELHVV